jgi:membrane-bound inhibitor of C-type lysozyme
MRLVILASTLALGACDQATETPKADNAAAPAATAKSTTGETVKYACDNGKTAAVTYAGSGTPEDKATVTIDGKTTVFKSAISASGAKYDAPGPTGVMSWWTKGDEASLFQEDSKNPDANDLVTTCKRQG